MVETQRGASAEDQKLQEILAAYRTATKAGAAPDPQELLARYPELAKALSAFFAEHEAPTGVL